MAGARLYDTIGATYTVTRRTEPRIAARFWAALGDARTVLNVGAGTGGGPACHLMPAVVSGRAEAWRAPRRGRAGVAFRGAG